MFHLLHNYLEKISSNLWLVNIGLSVFFGLLIIWIEAFFYKRLQPRLARTSSAWDESLIEAIHKPLQLFIYLMVFSFIIQIVIHKIGINGAVSQTINSVRGVLFLITVFWFGMRFIGNVENAITSTPAKDKKNHDKTTIRAISQLCRVSLIVISILMGMKLVGLPIATLLAVGGVGGIAIGFAAKDTLANFLGGMMIFWDRPFAVGDWIRSPDRQIEGTVENIGWRLTRIRTFDKRPLYVPNGTFSTIAVENPSRMTNRRIKTMIGLRYKDAPKVGAVLKDIENMLRAHPEIDTNQTLMVNLVKFADSSLEFMIYTFTKTTNWVKFQAVQQDVFLKSIAIITEHGAECAFPTTTLDISKEAVLSKPHLVSIEE